MQEIELRHLRVRDGESLEGRPLQNPRAKRGGKEGRRRAFHSKKLLFHLFLLIFFPQAALIITILVPLVAVAFIVTCISIICCYWAQQAAANVQKEVNSKTRDKYDVELDFYGASHVDDQARDAPIYNSFWDRPQNIQHRLTDIPLKLPTVKAQQANKLMLFYSKREATIITRRRTARRKSRGRRGGRSPRWPGTAAGTGAGRRSLLPRPRRRRCLS